MKLSKYTITGKIKDSSNYFIMNPLTKQADIISEKEYNDIMNNNFDENILLQKGYILDEETEERLYREKYLDFLDLNESTEKQIFFVPWYNCNFDCSYCYQSGYNNGGIINKNIIDSFFEYINNHISGKKYITLFGGEPLLSGSTYYDLIEYFIDKTIEHNLSIAIVTNGYNINKYINIFKKANIREIQVTLDGTEEVHNSRRYTKAKKGTFNEIIEGIDLLLDNNIPVNLRVVVDKDNIDNLPELAKFCISKGWTEKSIFKTQIGRNYELHYCQANKNKLFDRLSLYEKIYEITIEHPEFLEFHRPAFSISKFLFENGKMPDPLFDACPGCKTEWAFDYSGKIYPCTAMVGKEGEEVGTFYPEIKIFDEKVETWQSRDITSIDKCKTCNISLICGAGCAAVAKNKHGSLMAPDCRPQDKLVSLGISLYFEKSTVKI